MKIADEAIKIADEVITKAAEDKGKAEGSLKTLASAKEKEEKEKNTLLIKAATAATSASSPKVSASGFLSSSAKDDALVSHGLSPKSAKLAIRERKAEREQREDRERLAEAT